MLSLNEKNGFNEILKYYEENKDKPWKEWLEFVKIFKNNGKQGVVGLLKGKNNNMFFVFKLSQYINYLVQHESTVMKSLNNISEYCPHFSKWIGNITCEVDPYKKSDGNPLEIESKYTIDKDIMLSEYIDKSSKFYNFIHSDKIHEDILFSSVKQTLLAVSIAQREKKFTHYDLHSNNIMLKKCSNDLVFLYVLDSENQFCVHAKGYFPVLIDFGFAFSQDMNGLPLWSTLNHTDAGLMCDRYDRIADPKRFLVTVSDEIHNAKKTKKSRKLKNIAKNVYGRLKIDWYTAWDNDTENCATDYLFEKIKKTLNFSKVFKDYKYHCIDLIQTLITCPLQKQKKRDTVNLSLMIFLTEFVKLENQIGNIFNCLYILKNIVDIARIVREDYLGEHRERAVGYFKLALSERVDSITKYCSLKDINYEKMLCGLLCFARDIEYILYKSVTKRAIKKENDYKKALLQTPEELYIAVDINIPETYIFNEKTSVIVIDNIHKCCAEIKLSPEQTRYINSFKSLSRGMELYKIIQNIS